MEMYEIIHKEIESILKDTDGLAAPILNLHLPKRAKFERYLQTVLAYKLKSCYLDTEIEKPYPNNSSKHADIFSNNTFIEIKTVNTNYNAEGVESKTKPISKNINGIIYDIEKLQTQRVENGVVAFVLFPVDDEEKYKDYVKRITGVLKHKKAYKESVVGQFYVFSAKVLGVSIISYFCTP